MADWLRVALAIAAKDLRVELRSRTALIGSLVFAALVLVIFNFARDATLVSSTVLAPSVLWITIVFAAIIALNRGFALERENSALDGLLLAPASRSAIFGGKLLANLAFVFAVETVTVPLFVLFFNVPVLGVLPGLLAVMALATLGFVAVGTVYSAMAVRTRFAELMLPMLLLPFAVPVIIPAVQATSRLFAGRPLSEMLGWLRILALYDLVFVTLSLWIFPVVVEE